MAALKPARRRGRFSLATPTSRAFLIWAAIVDMAVAIDAKDLPTRHALTLEAARHVAKTAQPLAEQEGWPCSSP
jgi:hypothetical protein